jgi:hypothetical protein
LEPPEAAAPALGNGSAPLEAASAAEDASDYGSDNDDDDMPPLADQHIHTLEFPLERCCSGLPFFYAKQRIHTLEFPLERCCLGLLFSMQHDPDYAFVYVFV